MKKFSELGIKPVENKGLKGDKLNMNRVLNNEIEVEDFEINDSKYPKFPGQKCLTLQFRKNNSQHIVFTTSTVLMEQEQEVKKEDFPFKTTIVNNNGRFDFT